MRRNPEYYGLTEAHWNEMMERFRRAARLRLYRMECSRNLGEWTLAQLQRALSLKHGTRFPTFLELRAEFDPRLEVPDPEELVNQDEPDVALNELGGPQMPIKSMPPAQNHSRPKKGR